eukprot:TRINITY_DN16435_c0_g1_i1.p1 TRINITY_DN16435_c0_g1~~TRINITY_DN16435_c0_g1_i1.p1  ORF type:complete len:58 (-),score=7.93 TRINITY_DN16435_c0_g1_i1:392-565(-)
MLNFEKKLNIERSTRIHIPKMYFMESTHNFRHFDVYHVYIFDLFWESSFFQFFLQGA